MKIQQIQSIPLQGKKRFLDRNSLDSMRQLLRKINDKKTEQTYAGTSSYYQFLGWLNINHKGFFSDKRYLLNPSEDKLGESTLGFGRVRLTIDNITGEIIRSKKPFYKSWEKTLNEAKTLIVKAENNFDNKEIVTKKFIKIAKSIRKNSDKIFQNENNTVFLEPLNGVF